MPPTHAPTHLSPAELSYLHTSLSSYPPIRPDSRLATDFRPLNAETGVLPNTMGSAHVGFADGREAVVGVRAEVEKTARHGLPRAESVNEVEMKDNNQDQEKPKAQGRAEWVSLSLTLPGMRDDDKDLVFLEEMLREVLVTPSTVSSVTQKQTGAQSLQDGLVINTRWHWNLYIDVLLISPLDSTSTSANYPLPLLSMAIHLALKDTKIPRLKSEGQEDPVADDDWDAAISLYPRISTGSAVQSLLVNGLTPPVTLLMMAVGENVLFDPSSTELAVADGVWAISVGRSFMAETQSEVIKILSMRALETSARDTMKGVPRDADASDPNSLTGKVGDHILGSGTDQIITGVWKPKVGGVKRDIVIKVMKEVIGKDGHGVAKEILASLNGFLVSAS